MTIGQVAALGGVHTATVRYYERRGLLAAAPRTRAGYRQYGPETARRLRFIKHAQGLGFRLDDIQKLLALREADPASCPRVEAAARERIGDVRERIRRLERVERALDALVRSCAARRPTHECPLLDGRNGSAAGASDRVLLPR